MIYQSKIKLVIFAMFAIAAMVLYSCTKDSNIDEPEPRFSNLEKLNLDDARLLDLAKQKHNFAQQIKEGEEKGIDYSLLLWQHAFIQNGEGKEYIMVPFSSKDGLVRCLVAHKAKGAFNLRVLEIPKSNITENGIEGNIELKFLGGQPSQTNLYEKGTLIATEFSGERRLKNGGSEFGGIDGMNYIEEVTVYANGNYDYGPEITPLRSNTTTSGVDYNAMYYSDYYWGSGSNSNTSSTTITTNNVNNNTEKINEVIIKGQCERETLIELQKAVKKELILSMDDKGKVDYIIINPQKPLSANAQKLVDAIDDDCIKVIIENRDSHYNTNGGVLIGSFYGNTFVPDYHGNYLIIANQQVNTATLAAIAAAHNKPGEMLLHEVTEAYAGAIISDAYMTPSPAAGIPGSVYWEAHNQATPVTGKVYQCYFDAQGKSLSTNNGVVPPNTHSAEWWVIDSNGNAKLILKLP